MIYDCINIVVDAVTTVIGMFTYYADMLGVLVILVAFFTLYVIVNSLVKPMIGGSAVASSTRKHNSRNVRRNGNSRNVRRNGNSRNVRRNGNSRKEK